MSLRKRLRYAWNVFWTKPEYLEFNFDGLQELGQPVEEHTIDHVTVEQRQRERLVKVQRYAKELGRDIGIEVDDET